MTVVYLACTYVRKQVYIKRMPQIMFFREDLLFRSQEGRPPGENSANNENPLVGVYPRYHGSFRDDESDEDPEGDEVMPTQKVDSQAKFQVSDLTKLKRQLILGAPSCCIRFRSSRNDPMTSGFDWSLVDRVIKDGKGMEVCENCFHVYPSIKAFSHFS